MAEEDKDATPEQTPANVVTDNSGVVPVQPVATTDPTLNDNTNPKVPFDGADPRNIPPHDSNEQLHIAAEKRAGAESENLDTAADRRREAVTAAYDNDRDVREVLNAEGSDTAGTKAAADRGARVQPPQGRTGTPPSRQTTDGSSGKSSDGSPGKSSGRS